MSNKDSISDVLAERGNRYGRFDTHASLTQDLKRVVMTRYMDDPDVIPLAPDQREALEMIFHKIGRIVNGDPNYADSWIDIAGYAKLVADRLQSEEARKCQ